MCQRAMVSTSLLGFKPRPSVVGGMGPGAGHHCCLADRSCLLFLCIQIEHRTLLSTLQLLYTVGYSLSIVSLFLALTLLLFLRWVELLPARAQAGIQACAHWLPWEDRRPGWVISWLVSAGGDLRQSPVHPSHFYRQREGIWEVLGEVLSYPGLPSTARTGIWASQLCLCLFGLDELFPNS